MTGQKSSSSPSLSQRSSTLTGYVAPRHTLLPLSSPDRIIKSQLRCQTFNFSAFLLTAFFYQIIFILYNEAKSLFAMNWFAEHQQSRLMNGLAGFGGVGGKWHPNPMATPALHSWPHFPALRQTVDCSLKAKQSFWSNPAPCLQASLSRGLPAKLRMDTHRSISLMEQTQQAVWRQQLNHDHKVV